MVANSTFDMMQSLNIRMNPWIKASHQFVAHWLLPLELTLDKSELSAWNITVSTCVQRKS